MVNILDEELARYPDVIAVSSIDESASEVQFDLATANGIPIVAFDSGNSYQGIQCICRTDNKEAAKTGVKKLCEAIGDSGEIALLLNDSVSENGKEKSMIPLKSSSFPIGSCRQIAFLPRRVLICSTAP